MQQYQQAQLRQHVAYMQQAQAMMAAGGYPGAPPFPMPSYPGAVPYMGSPQAPGSYAGSYGGKGDFSGKGKGKFSKGGFKGGKGKKGGFKGKSKGKGEDGEDDPEGEGDGEQEKVRKDEPPIVKAQREARERAEAVILEKLQGRWVDKADSDVTYAVEGNTVSVSNKNGGRVFHNRLSMYGVEFCWNAKRFWHDLNLTAMNSCEGDLPEQIEWNPGKSSPPAEQIVWLRAPPEPESEKVDATDDGQPGAGEDATPACGVAPVDTDPSSSPNA
jgi:hypothetical protein